MFGRDQAVTGEDHDPHLEPLFQRTDGVALVIQDIEGDIAVDGYAKFIHPAFRRLILDHPQHLQRGRFDRPDPARPLAMRADRADRFIEAESQPLARHFQKTEMADRPDLNPRAVVAHRVLHATLDGLLVPVVLHIDEVDNNQARQVAKAKLSCQLVGCLEIRFQRRFLDIALACRAAGIDVDGDQRLGLVDDKIAT